MSAAGTITGLGGRVTTGVDGVGGIMPRVTRWSIKRKVQGVAWADSSTRGFEASVSGRRSCRGKVEGKVDVNLLAANLLLYPGEGSLILLQLWFDDTTIANGTDNFFDFPCARVTSGTDFRVDMNTQEVDAWEFEFVSVGVFGRPGIPLLPRTYPG